MKPRFALALLFFIVLRLAAQDTPPRAIYQATPVYPLEVRRAGLSGKVVVGFVVDSKGQVRNPVAISSTNPALNQPAIDAILKWRFTPGVRKGVPRDTRMEVPILFSLNMPNGGNEAYEVSGSHVDQSKLPPELRYDVPPKPANVVFAVYPFELLRDGVGGTAEVKFLVSPQGKVEQAAVINATRPEFGQALLAMLNEWSFQPAMKDGKPTWALMNIKQEFSDVDGDVPVSNKEQELLRELKRKKPALCPAKDLDAPPQLVSQHSPVFPSALLGQMAEGHAIVEFLVADDGSVQLPRVVSATDPAFGYAAVQGVAAWKFAPPTSHGEPVDIRVQVPVEFSTPKSATERAPTTIIHGSFDQPPVPRFQAAISYPTEMRRRGIAGTVTVGFTCDTEGRVRDVQVITSSGSGELDQAAVAGVSKWIYNPGMKDGHAVDLHMEVPIAFDLPGK